jgi:hypothetical protein
MPFGIVSSTIVLLVAVLGLARGGIDECVDVRQNEFRVPIGGPELTEVRIESLVPLRNLYWDQAFVGSPNVVLTVDHLLTELDREQSAQNTHIYYGQVKGNVLQITIDLENGDPSVRFGDDFIRFLAVVKRKSDFFVFVDQRKPWRSANRHAIDSDINDQQTTDRSRCQQQ